MLLRAVMLRVSALTVRCVVTGCYVVGVSTLTVRCVVMGGYVAGVGIDGALC